MTTYTLHGSRRDSGAEAVGFLLALAFAAMALAPQADPGEIAACALFALLAGLAGAWGLAETIQPPTLQLTTDGFTFRRPLRPVREVKWRDVDQVGVVRRAFGPSVYYQVAGSERRHGFFLFAAQPHQLAEAMNRCLDRARPRPAPASPQRAPVVRRS
jgi:hypothetical protein